MAQEFQIQTTQNVALGYQPASLGDRILAYLVDILIRTAYLIFVFVVADTLTLVSADRGIVGIFVVLLPYIFYHLLFEIFNNGQSPGKRAFQIRVVRVDGEPVTVGNYFLRWLFRLIDINLMSGLVAIIAIAASDKGQRLGDMVAGTTVIKERQRYNIRQLAYEEAEPEYVPTYPQVVRLESRHIEVIKETLDNLEIDNIHNHVELLAAKISRLMNVEYTEHPRKFLRTVVRDFTHYNR